MDDEVGDVPWTTIQRFDHIRPCIGLEMLSSLMVANRQNRRLIHAVNASIA
jgi:hypothetical protein